MTNELLVEEAVELLKEKRMEINYQVNGTTRFSKALDMAIKALEQQPITWIVGKDNCQVAVRNMPIDKMQKICAIIGEEEQQPCEDYISCKRRKLNE